MSKTIKRESKVEVRLGQDPTEREPLTKQLLHELEQIELLEKDAKEGTEEQPTAH